MINLKTKWDQVNYNNKLKDKLIAVKLQLEK